MVRYMCQHRTEMQKLWLGADMEQPASAWKSPCWECPPVWSNSFCWSNCDQNIAGATAHEDCHD